MVVLFVVLRRASYNNIVLSTRASLEGLAHCSIHGDTNNGLPDRAVVPIKKISSGFDTLFCIMQ